MKYILLIAVIYGIYRFTRFQKSLEERKRAQLNQEEDDEGFIDYEEIE